MWIHWISFTLIFDLLYLAREFKACKSACSIGINGYSIRYFISIYRLRESRVYDLWREKETNG